MMSRLVRSTDSCTQRCLQIFALLLLLGGLVAVSVGQTAGTGAIAGTITDPSGAVITGASVTVIDAAGATRTVLTGANGGFLITLLQPGTYRVQVNKTGFKQMVSADIPVHVTETVALNLQLQVGSATETVEVMSAQELLKTEDATLGQVVDEKQVSALPLVTRNYTQILGLSAGVSAEVFNAAEIGRGGINTGISSNGSNFLDNNYQMNGVEINDREGSGYYSGGTATPNPDSIQEFKVQTSQYDSSSGRNSGANVNVVTKSGTNDFHGSAWEYFRNEALNANTYFRNQTHQPREVLRQNQFGFTLGGPLKKNKLLFFTSYQGTRQQNGIDPGCSSSVTLPVLTNDRSAAGLAAAVGPNTVFGGADMFGRPVTADNISQPALALFNRQLPDGEYLIPNPQIIQTENGLQKGFSTFSTPCPYTEDQFITNLDWVQNEKSTFRGRFFFSNSQSTLTLTNAGSTMFGMLPGSPQVNPQNFRNFSLTHTYTFSSRVVNQAELGFHRTFASATPQPAYKFSDIGVTAPDFDNADPLILVVGGFGLGGGQFVTFAQNTYVAQDTLSWSHGHHNFRFGGGFTQGQLNEPNFVYPGTLVFLDYPGLMLGTAPVAPYQVADVPGLLARHWRMRDISGFVQDDIKVTPRFTVNLGFRFERLGDPGEIDGRNATMDPALIDPNPPDDGSFAGFLVSSNYPGTPPPGVVSSGNNLGIRGIGQNTINPRVGFAWSLPGTDRFVLRGGYGIYHQTIAGQPFFQQLTNQPFGLARINAPNFTQDFVSPFEGDPGAFPQFIPYSPTTSQSPFLLSPDLRPPTLQKYSLTLQTQLTKDLALEVGYAGARNTHLLVTVDINQANLASATNPIRGEATNTVANIPLRVPYQGFSAGSMNMIEPVGSGWYNALQASLTKRFSHGLQFLASYTFARSLTNANDVVSAFTAGSLNGDQTNLRRNYGPDSFIRPHRFVLSAVYELPSRDSLVGHVLGGWRLSGVATIQSGHRLTPYITSSDNAYGVIYDFGNFVPGCKLGTGGSVTKRVNSNWFNSDCLAPYPVIGADETATGFGNGSTGMATGPGQANVDISVAKLFRLSKAHEKLGLEFRTEAFNVFNHPIFSDPALNVGDTTSFGKIVSVASNPRIIQFALKLAF